MDLYVLMYVFLGWTLTLVTFMFTWYLSFPCKLCSPQVTWTLKLVIRPSQGLTNPKILFSNITTCSRKCIWFNLYYTKRHTETLARITWNFTGTTYLVFCITESITYFKINVCKSRGQFVVNKQVQLIAMKMFS